MWSRTPRWGKTWAPNQWPWACRALRFGMAGLQPCSPTFQLDLVQAPHFSGPRFSICSVMTATPRWKELPHDYHPRRQGTNREHPIDSGISPGSAVGNSYLKGAAALIPGKGRSPGGGHGHPLQYSCLGNPMDRGTWLAAIHGVAKEVDMT